MAPLNPYLTYKRDTSRLIFWIVKASNAIITSSSTLPDDVPRIPNTNGQITVSNLTALSKLIAKHIDPIPSAILALFDLVIKARSATYAAFQRLVTNKSDPGIERSNASHKHFIDALSEAFEALGGSTWAENLEPADQAPNDEADLEQVLFANKFAALRLDGDTASKDANASDNESDLEPQQRQSPQRRQQRKPGRGKKGKHGKNANKKKPLPEAKTQSIEDVPLESYRIIQDEEGITTDYLMAVYALVHEWVRLRGYLQGLWKNVAYNGLNSAVAGSMSNMTVKMIQRSATAMFVDFPGHDSYETVMKTITRGDPDKAQGMFNVALHQVNVDKSKFMKAQEVDIDVKEQFLIYAYRDLLDFITDFQKTRSGKPTKRMLSELSNWDPNFDLQRASETERLSWRRSYTINWLYDLVNVFSSIVVQRITMKGETHTLESVDWSPSGPWDGHRRIFGLKEFAGVITHLAMQKDGSDIRHKILPHHVFQLQCIVDSFTVSRGWSLSVFYGHVLQAPAQDFRAQRDIDLFLDRRNERVGSGFLQAVDVLKQLFDKDEALHNRPKRHDKQYDLLEAVQYDFVNWLGESKYMYGLTDIPPSRFSNTNSNGLWDYSPFLCGVGLEEGLEDAYRYSFLVLDMLPEPVLLVHLHNMLVQKGYITEPVGLYASFQELFPDAFFIGGKIPTSDFDKAMRTRVALLSTRPSGRETDEDIRELRINRFFKIKSYLMEFACADWNVDRIPDSSIPMPSALGVYRISQTKHVTDPITGQKRMEDTDLVNRARARGISDKDLMEWAKTLPLEEKPVPEHIHQMMIPKGYKMGRLSQPGSMGPNHQLSSESLLPLLQVDISNDICGDIPLSSLNYVWVMARFMLMFHHFEDELAKLRNPLYVQAYEIDPRWRLQKRAGLTYLALQTQDEECLRVMAREFQNPRAGFMNHIYWNDLESRSILNEKLAGGEIEVPEHCTVM